MLTMEYDIQIGGYRLGALDSVKVRKSVETLSDTATIILPATYINHALDVESRLQEGDEVVICLGYNGDLKTEFKGYLKTIQTDDAKITLECEDALYCFRKELADKEHKNITVKTLLQKVAQEVDRNYSVVCDYEFSYDKFVIRNATAWDVLKKVQDETKANIYFKDTTLHCHPQYSAITNSQPVIYDFAMNIERSQLLYKRADERKYLVEVEGVGKDGKRIKTNIGKAGGEKRSVKVYGVTDIASLRKRAEEELALVVYTGFEGSFTGWLIPFCEPAYQVALRDSEYPHKNGIYYVVATEVAFSSSGGERTITIGKKIG
ncbi:MAG: hypothetical protein NC038_05495 [Paludibacter sp.]|nr:hypothetical protein [Bacteroidales bacterium]MCM1069825.1 hypothetical protein [Prevotella sp.]MCM1353981.1 hypothetical protein [Bacteroides sp.]MCM1443377.1 hypothetical protein [Muribaculum sp.]MCM1482080.1 hypothetical protein [Paludibacter sp.]